MDERRAVVPALRELAEHQDPTLALRAAETLYTFTGDARRAVEERIAQFRRLVDEENYSEARIALFSTGLYKAQAKPALDIALEALDFDGRGRIVHAEALDVIRRIGPGAGAAVPRLLDYADTAEPLMLTGELAQTLGELGAPAKASLPFLLEVLAHEDRETRRIAREAIGGIVQALREEDRDASEN